MDASDRYPTILVQGGSLNVLQAWLSKLSYKQQTVLLVALRGYDSVSKTDKSKPLIKALRSTVLQNADTSEPFMHVALEWKDIESFFKDSHHYPLHWFMHFVHAIQIIGYKHPQDDIRKWWSTAYLHACDMLHVNPETEEQMDVRLRDKR